MRVNIWNFIDSPRSTYCICIIFFAIAVVFSVIYHSILPICEGAPSLKYQTCDFTVTHVTSFLDCLYFSITSQTKVGYGDIVPASDGSMISAMIQVSFGYFFIAFLIAFFVCKALVKSDTFRSRFIPALKEAKFQ